MKGIPLFIFGDVAEMEIEPQNAKMEFYLAMVEPAATIFAGFLFLLVEV
jgi:hypothetical protein